MHLPAGRQGWSFLTGLPGGGAFNTLLHAYDPVEAEACVAVDYVDRMVLMIAVRVETPSFRRMAFR